MDTKKSIVNYDDDEDDDQHATRQHLYTKVSETTSHKQDNFKYHHYKESSSDKLEKNLKRNESYKDESLKKGRHHYTSHYHRHHSHSSSDRHRRHHDRDRSPNYRRRNRSRSRSRSRNRKDAFESSRYSPKNKSKSCQKSKRNRSRSPKRDLKRERSRLSQSKSPQRKNIQEPKAEHCSSSDTDKGNVQIKEPIIIKLEQPKLPTVPKYYNTQVVNPTKVATLEEKRKLLWGDTKKDNAPNNSSTKVWTNLKFQGEHGSEMTEKFRKLMGIKSNGNESASCDNAERSDMSNSQEKLFQNLDMQYSIARMSTHTHRGVGLGFGAKDRPL